MNQFQKDLSMLVELYMDYFSKWGSVDKCA